MGQFLISLGTLLGLPGGGDAAGKDVSNLGPVGLAAASAVTLGTDVRVRRTGAHAVAVDDGAGGSLDITVTGTLNSSTAMSVGGSAGITQTVTIRDGTGSPFHVLQFTGGILTGYTTT